jgi:hypothetical protein
MTNLSSLLWSRSAFSRCSLVVSSLEIHKILQCPQSPSTDGRDINRQCIGDVLRYTANDRYTQLSSSLWLVHSSSAALFTHSKTRQVTHLLAPILIIDDIAALADG